MSNESFIKDCFKNYIPVFSFDLSNYIRKIAYDDSKPGLIKVTFINNRNNLETHIFEVNLSNQNILASKILDIVIQNINHIKIPINTKGDILLSYFISISSNTDTTTTLLII